MNVYDQLQAQTNSNDTVTKPNKISSICVFCGSSPGNNPVYLEQTNAFAKQMLKNGYNLVYGGGTVGLMGMLARTIHEGGGGVTGIIPAPLAPREISGECIGNTIVVADMHTRKAKMSSLCDAFVALPGGFGTLEELFEVITWQQLGIHVKPIGLLNINGFFNNLLAFIDLSITSGFISEIFRNILVVESDPEKLLEKLAKHTP
eukprot:CAMPEP_0168563842 /NCGR_PEP_ID=MMETSP0413-20121227/12894_1 /TAXON_ID=136452 /ORGANISM="Filamoeba nolandi, Strain NC-AS-23-1" /LENGTH=203 /DNA_ID=CAMNT_0008595407 /DNA_START=27 /DNA_END=634 /DNA_ORIENTATION=-